MPANDNTPPTGAWIKAVAGTVIAVLGIAIMYGFAAFTHFDFDPGEWAGATRFLFAFFSVVFIILVIDAVSEVE